MNSIPRLTSVSIMSLASPITRALALRDGSLAQISPPLRLENLPDPLPQNVCEIRHQVLEPEEIEITSLDADEILAAIRSQKYSCVTVTKAFLRAAALAQVLVRHRWIVDAAETIKASLLIHCRRTASRNCFLDRLWSEQPSLIPCQSRSARSMACPSLSRSTTACLGE